MPREGIEFIRQAAQILNGSKITSEKGVYKKGDGLSIIVDVEKEEDGLSMCVGGSIFGHGNMTANWTGVQVYLSNDSGLKYQSEIYRDRGTKAHFTIHDIVPGDYQIYLSLD